MSRQRVEDLGRILGIVEKILDHEIFDEKYWSRPKEACDWFERQTDEKKEDVIHELAYGIEFVNHTLCEISCICKGFDDLAEHTK